MLLFNKAAALTVTRGALSPLGTADALFTFFLFSVNISTCRKNNKHDQSDYYNIFHSYFLFGRLFHCLLFLCLKSLFSLHLFGGIYGKGD